MLPAHVAGTQTVPWAYRAHCPDPSQSPVMPQDNCSSRTHFPWASSCPRAIAVQLPPLPGRLHAWQAPSHAPSQQTPSAQDPDWHSSFFVQTAPFGFSPQLPSTQARPPVHCSGPAHLSKHLFVPGSQPNGTQTVGCPSTHFPCEQIFHPQQLHQRIVLTGKQRCQGSSGNCRGRRKSRPGRRLRRPASGIHLGVTAGPLRQCWCRCPGCL